MTNSTAGLESLFYILIAIMMALFIALAVVFINMKIKEKQAKEEESETAGKKNKRIKNFNVDSVFNFMEFDKVEDNMIVQKGGKRYIMVIECQGINYDLMSQAEKVGVEAGFVQFLNTLSHPIQIYTQTRKINLESSLQTYRLEVDKVAAEYRRQEEIYNRTIRSDRATENEKNEALYEFTKEKNLYEYGKDIIYNTEKMSLNKNILNNKYYIVVPYFSEELGTANFSKEEIRELAFSELYTRCQALIRSLAVSGVNGKVLSSTELVDLLYVAYNRDESDTYGVDKAIRAGYDELYSTAPDYINKKIQILNKEIEKKAVELANQKISEARTEKEKEYQEQLDNTEDIIADLALLIIEENKKNLGKEVTQKAKEKVRSERKEKEENVQE